MEFFTSLAKYILICFNTLFAIFAIVLIAIGGVVLANESKGLESFTDFSVGAFAIGVGVIILLIAGFGFFGAIKKNGFLLTAYAITLILIFIIQVVVGALAFVQIQNGEDLSDKVRNIVKQVFKDGDQQLIDDIQQWFECCGVTGPNYWKEEAGSSIPSSCYENNDTSMKMYQDGCTTAFKDVISRYITVIGVIGIVFGVIELLGAIFAFMVRHSISDY